MAKKLMILLIALSLAAGSFLFAQAQEEAVSEDVVEVRLSWWTNEVRTAVTLATIEAYEAEHPNVKIIPEYTGWAGYWDKLETQIAANETPDIFQVTQELYIEYAEGNIITPLNDFAMDFDKIDQAALDAWTVDGDVYGLPLGLNGWALLYNPDIFDRANVSYPTADWTWEDFEAKAEAITQATGLYGCSFVLMDQDLPFLPRQAGYKLYADDGKSWGFTDYSFIEDYLAMYDRMQKSGSLIEQSFTEENFNNWAANPISFGEAAMLFIPSNQASPVYDGLGKAIPFAPIPGSAERKAQILSAALGFTMAADTEHPEIVADLLNYFATDPAALELGQANRGVPATEEARNFMLENGVDDALAEAFKFVSMASPISSPLTWSPNPKRSELNELVDNVFAQVMFGELTPSEGAEEIYTKGNEILGR